MKRTFVRKRIKAQAMVSLQGSWMKAFGIIIAQLVLSVFILSFLPLRMPTVDEILGVQDDAMQMLRLFVPDVITKKTIASVVVTLALYVIVMAPLSVGICRFFLKVARGEKAKFSDAFSPYTSLRTVFASVWLELLIAFMSAFWSFLFMLVPTLLIVLCAYAKLYFLANILIFLVPASALFSIFWNSRYVFAKYIFAEGKAEGAFASLRECISLMHGRTFECIILRASYLLWDIVSSQIWPLSYVYTALSGTVYAGYLFYLRGDKNSDETASSPTV